MRVILLENVPKVGQKYDVKDVSDGYGRNFLIKQGKAKLATEKEEKYLAEQKKYAEAEQNIQHDLLVKNIQELEGKEVHVRAKANEKGHLFASVHPEDISKAIKQELGIDIPTAYIESSSIKETGEHAVPVQTDRVYTELKILLEAA